MALLDSIGTSMKTGGQRTVPAIAPTGNTFSTISLTAILTSYIIDTQSAGDTNAETVDHYDEDGKRIARLIFQRDRPIPLTLICKAGATPEADFPSKDMCTVTGLTHLYVESLAPSRSKDAERVTVTLVDLGIT